MVKVSFPGSVPGVTAPPSALAPNPFIRVDILDHVQTFFSALLSHSSTQNVRAFAVCGLVVVKSTLPIEVLDPRTTSLSLSGTPTISVVGGPSQSIQVNSTSSTAVSIGGSSTIDLTKGGPSGTGSSLGVTGGPTTAPSGFHTAGKG